MGIDHSALVPKGSLEQCFSNRVIVALGRHWAMCADSFGCHILERRCYWHLVGAGLGHGYTSCDIQGPSTKNEPVPHVNIGEVNSRQILSLHDVRCLP